MKRWTLVAVCGSMVLGFGATAFAQQDTPAPVVRGRRASPPQPQQQQGADYFAGTWSFSYIGREHPLTHGPRTGVAVFTKQPNGTAVSMTNEGKTDAGAAYKETATYTWNASTKTMAIAEPLVGAQLKGNGNWSSPLSIHFEADPITANGQTLKIRRTYNIFSAQSFEIVEELSTNGGPYQRLGNATFTKK